MKKRIGLFLPANTAFYRALFKSLKAAFEKYGYPVSGGCGFLSGRELNEFINQQQPDVFFEMNRCKNEIAGFPETILHFCWLVDLTGRKLDDIKGSEAVYFFNVNWLADYHNVSCRVNWLPPASDPKIYFPLTTKKYGPAVFVGHIPSPWTDGLLNRVIDNKGSHEILFADVIRKFEKKWTTQDSIVNNDRYIDDVMHWLSTEAPPLLDDPTLRYDIGCRIVRQSRRCYFMDWFLNHNVIDSIDIWGSFNWMHYPSYRPYYRGQLESPEAINIVFNQSEFVLHEGVTPHFRIFDAILSGTPVVIRKSEQDTAYGGIGGILDENIDYIAMDFERDEFDKLACLSKDKACLENMVDSARRKVLHDHTWEARMRTVIDDIETMLV